VREIYLDARSAKRQKMYTSCTLTRQRECQVIHTSETPCCRTNNTATTLKQNQQLQLYLMHFNINFIGERSKKNSLLKSKNRSSIAVKKKNSRKEVKRKKKDLRWKKIVP